MLVLNVVKKMESFIYICATADGVKKKKKENTEM